MATLIYIGIHIYHVCMVQYLEFTPHSMSWSSPSNLVPIMESWYTTTTSCRPLQCPVW